MLAEEENLAGLARLNRALIGRAETMDSDYRTILDMDSTEIPVYGEQEQSAYNGYFESTCFHPLLLFNRQGDCLAAKLRPGNVHSAEGWEELLLPEIERQQQMGKEVAFRGDAAFAKPEVYEALEERGVKYAIRVPANDSLERDIAELLPRPVGRPSQKPLVEYKGFLYQAASWKTARRVAAKVGRNSIMEIPVKMDFESFVLGSLTSHANVGKTGEKSWLRGLDLNQRPLGYECNHALLTR